MPKFKPKKSISKRFRITKNGKVMFRGSHVRHLRRTKRKGQLRAQKIAHQMSGKMAKKIKQVLGK